MSLLLHGTALAVLYWMPVPSQYQGASFSIGGGGGGGSGGYQDGDTQALEAGFSKTARFALLKLPATPSTKMQRDPASVTLPASDDVPKMAAEVSARSVPTPIEDAAAEPPVKVPPLNLPKIAPAAVGPAPVNVAAKIELPKRTFPHVAMMEAVEATAGSRNDVPRSEQTAADRPSRIVSVGGASGDAGRVGGKGTAASRGPLGDGRRPGSGGAGGSREPAALGANPKPIYPPDALARGVEGVVLLHVRIRRDGTVEDVRVEQSSGDKSLDNAALSTVRQHWRFMPAQENGVEVACQRTLPIRFRIPST